MTSPQVSRSERHRNMAETRHRQHQAMTAAHINGQTPVCPTLFDHVPGAKFFSPAFGESVALLSTDGQDHMALLELRMYWQRLPDFGITRFEVYPDENGWAQVLYWGGSTTEGKLYEAQEAGIYKTDADCRILRMENYHDWQQWRTLAAFACGQPVDGFDRAAYVAALKAQARTPQERAVFERA